jgi:hypothetical protein
VKEEAARSLFAPLAEVICFANGALDVQGNLKINDFQKLTAFNEVN